MRHIQYLIAYLVATLAGAAVASEADTLLGHLEKEVSLAAEKIEEPCFTMAMGDRLMYSFEADTGLDFNIHYHENDSVSFPVSVKNREKEEGEFFATGSRQYCMMWTNQTESAVQLSYSYKIFRRELSQ